jgi:two-component system response regulator MprA
MTQRQLLVADDDPALRRTLARALLLEGYDVVLAEDGAEALERLGSTAFEAALVDVAMPHVDGLTVCRRMRAAGDRTPVLMLTARDAVADRVAGLDAGADDYLVKPFALDELHARVRALLRRFLDEQPRELLRYADLEVDLMSYTARRGERALDLTRTEHRLLELFMRSPEQALRREHIYERVWGHDLSRTSNSLDVYVGYLRRKTEGGGEPRLLHTVRGLGFRLSG